MWLLLAPDNAVAVIVDFVLDLSFNSIFHLFLFFLPQQVFLLFLSLFLLLLVGEDVFILSITLTPDLDIFLLLLLNLINSIIKVLNNFLNIIDVVINDLALVYILG
jgi:hypothetical protein